MAEMQRLRETVTALENELRDLDSLDDEARDLLTEALREIQIVLSKGGVEKLQQGSLLGKLEEATEKFEAEHPAFTQTLARLIDGLGQMGI